MWPTSVAIPVAVTTNSPAPRVTLVFMYTMPVTVAKRRAGALHGLGALGDGQALPGQRGLIDLQRGRLQQPPVGRDDIARLDRDDVPGNQLPGRDLRQLAVPPHPGLDDRHLLQGGDGRGGLALLPQVHDRVEQRQQDQQDARVSVSCPTSVSSCLLAVSSRLCPASCGGSSQHRAGTTLPGRSRQRSGSAWRQTASRQFTGPLISGRCAGPAAGGSRAAPAGRPGASQGGRR